MCRLSADMAMITQTVYEKYAPNRLAISLVTARASRLSLLNRFTLPPAIFEHGARLSLPSAPDSDPSLSNFTVRPMHRGLRSSARWRAPPERWSNVGTLAGFQFASSSLLSVRASAVHLRRSPSPETRVN